MNLQEAIQCRHSVRQYTSRPFNEDTLAALREEVTACNNESGLHIQLITNEPKAFDRFMAHYGKFGGVSNYFAIVGKAGTDLQEKCGYWGERLVLKAQQLGLNTCWVALTFSKVKSAYVLNSGEKLVAVIALGYGKTQGVPHKSKPLGEVVKAGDPIPDWLRAGAEAALLAPTAMNQQKFLLMLDGNHVSAKAAGGFYSKIDLGIVNYVIVIIAIL